MFEKLKCLIFGLGEFEKSKIELRFELAREISLKIKIESILDFEIIESCIYKIRDLLRVKSSNLNKAINDSSRNIKKREVIELLEILDKLKTEYLQRNGDKIELDTKKYKDTKNEIQTDKTIENKEKKTKDEELPENIEILSKAEYSIILGIEKIPYILIKFETEINFSVLKNVMLIFFEEYKPHGSNIIIEDKSILVIPRMNEDNIISLPSLEVDNENIYNIIKKNQLTQNKLDSNLNNTKEFVPIENYSEVRKKSEKKSLKQKEESLDNLLEAINQKTSKSKEIRDAEFETREGRQNIESKKEKNLNTEIVGSNIVNSSDRNEINTLNTSIKNKKNEADEIKLIPGDSIEFEKKSEIELLKEQIIIETKNVKNKEVNRISDNVNSSLVIYEDDKIKAYVENNSRSCGEIIISMNSGQKISNLNESDLSYLIIFSKVFSQVLFNEVNAHGSNMIFDYSSNKIRIISRDSKDDLTNLSWQLKESSDDFLEQVKNKLFSEMSKEVKETQDVGLEIESKKEEIIAEENSSEIYYNKTQNGNKKIRREIQEINASLDLINELQAKKELKAPSPKKEEKDVIKIDTALEKKAKYILEALRRIP